MSTQALLAVGFGFVFVTVIAAVAIWITATDRQPPPAAFLLFRVIVALAAAGVGAVLPGMLDVEISGGNGLLIKAACGFGLFVIIYLINPPVLVGAEAEKRDIVDVARETLKALHDLDNVIRDTVAPVTRFEKTWPTARRDKAVASMQKLADKEVVLPRVRQLVGELERKSSDSRHLRRGVQEAVDLVLRSGKTTLKTLGESTDTPFAGPAELAALIGAIQSADTDASEPFVMDQAGRVVAVVDRRALAEADRLVGALR
jgi:hypothetical protein